MIDAHHKGWPVLAEDEAQAAVQERVVGRLAWGGFGVGGGTFEMRLAPGSRLAGDNFVVPEPKAPTSDGVVAEKATSIEGSPSMAQRLFPRPLSGTRMASYIGFAIGARIPPTACT
jgi:hypothetical protein